MNEVFRVEDRQAAFEFVLSAAMACDKIISLVQVGSGAAGFHDERSDLDFVIALDAGDSMPEIMEYMRRQISGQYELLYCAQDEARHLQVFLLYNLLEIDIGYGGYEHAAALKPAFKVLYDRSGTVEEKMIRSREWIDQQIYGNKRKKDLELACKSVWMRLMHAAVAIHRGQFFRVIGELENVRKLYADLVGDRHCLESSLYREMDRLPEEEKTVIMGTFVTGKSADELWNSLLELTDLIYGEIGDAPIPVSREKLYAYYRDLR